MVPPLKVVIADDEPLARERLRNLLSKHPEAELVGECSDGAEAVTTILEQEPDIVFLDVQMPEKTGFEVIQEIRGQVNPLIIFVTAYDQYALKAFEVSAVDYLLKPYDKERFEAAFAKARQAARKPEEMTKNLESLLANLNQPAREVERIAIKTANKVLLLKKDQIDWVDADDNYINVHTGQEKHLLRETLASFEEKLGPRKFMRISRSVIVNIDRIKELQPLFHGEYSVILKDGTRLTLSRSYRDKVQGLLENG